VRILHTKPEEIWWEREREKKEEEEVEGGKAVVAQDDAPLTKVEQGVFLEVKADFITHCAVAKPPRSRREWTGTLRTLRSVARARLLRGCWIPFKVLTGALEGLTTPRHSKRVWKV
jgi:hypothetical protein